MSWPAVVLLLVGFAAVGVLLGRGAVGSPGQWVWPALGAAVVTAGTIGTAGTAASRASRD